LKHSIVNKGSLQKPQILLMFEHYAQTTHKLAHKVRRCHLNMLMVQGWRQKTVLENICHKIFCPCCLMQTRKPS